MKPLLKLENVWKIYNLGKISLEVLRDVSIDIYKKDFVVVFGPSGSGKSTLLNIMSCLDIPTKGKVFLEGKDISTLHEDDLAEIRGKKNWICFSTI